ncbi:hypothetical protein GLOIN_2v1816266 [Rhizophagus clarus]|uniref:Uncharacterized protein n=1 Tax=Rhizophagus clarus TaxID=94130 RepID=A0A8H3QS31_9GLOM|nr:hypothetical protein GLOIN_2v1816266 [Rhizophagus clarus]
MDSLKCKSEQEYIKLSDKNISLELAKMELEDTLAKKKNELMQVRDDLLSAQKAVIEKDSFLQETNTLLLEQILKISSESEVLGGISGLEKDNGIASPEITPKLPNSVFFQHAIIFLLIEKSDSDKTNLLGNLVLSDKDEYMQEDKKGRSCYIKCDDLIICGYHFDEPKWTYVRYIYNMILKDPKAPFYENISFRYIPPEKIPSIRAFLPERSTLIIFKDLCLVLTYIQNQISQFFRNGRHQYISNIYFTQKYYKVPTFIRENISYLVMYNGGDSQQDVFKIADFGIKCCQMKSMTRLSELSIARQKA